VAGICAGIGGYSGLDVILVRVIVTALAVITGSTGALACLAAWMIIPRRRREDLDRPGHPRPEPERLIRPATARPAAERNLDMDTTDPIRRVSVVSTGQVQIRPDHLAEATGLAPTLATV
jgi:phage shock protein PspC (stress-responsive transcriptional regulator)